jgi:hypothetical protein
VAAILDSNYLDRDPALAESAIHKLEKGMKAPNGPPNWLAMSCREREKFNEISWLGDVDSNHDKRSQSPLSYR